MHYFNSTDLLNTLIWDVQDDAAVLDGISKAGVRDLFQAWVTQATANVDPDSREIEDPRYRFCIHVDDEAMRSVLQFLDTRDSRVFEEGYVNLVAAEWEPDPDEEEMSPISKAPRLTMWVG
ncbi:hypothetical protein B9Z65_6288 [Elsinoe australis]|uniref:Uncharacterized protein n=1 Tax=Elsinoe australis TaxID=40998 RepID=A0A2P8A877_9PEZI|nr:hypothetical protein B9Z65_6288 [Elsinoe australis]